MVETGEERVGGEREAGIKFKECMFFFVACLVRFERERLLILSVRPIFRVQALRCLPWPRGQKLSPNEYAEMGPKLNH